MKQSCMIFFGKKLRVYHHARRYKSTFYKAGNMASLNKWSICAGIIGQND